MRAGEKTTDGFYFCSNCHYYYSSLNKIQEIAGTFYHSCGSNCRTSNQKLFTMIRSLLLFLAIIVFMACNEQVATADTKEKKDTISCPPGSSKLDIAKIEQITGMKGT